MEKLKLKVIYNVPRMKMEVSNDLKKYLSKDNIYYDFVNINEDPDFILCLDFKYWKKTFPLIIRTNKNILSNIIIFDRFKLNNITALRRLYLGTLSIKNTIEIPFIPGRAEKLINDYNVEFSKEFIYNKKGVIVICPNRNTQGWYMYNNSTLSNNLQIEKVINIIKNNSNLDIEIRLHPLVHDNSVLYFINKYNLKINKDNIDTLSTRAYCIIADRSSIGVKMVLKGNLVFNFQDGYEHSIIGKICITNPKYLNPENLEIDKIPSLEDRYNYLQFIATQTYTDDEINNGYFLENIYKLLLDNKDLFIKN